MKTRILAIALVMMSLFAVAPAFNDAQAQQANVGQALAGLINVNIGAIQADIDVDNVLNDFTLVNVEDVLNDSEIRILNNVLNNNVIASNNRDILTNLLRDADIIDDVAVVVGVLTGGQLVIQ